MSQKRCYILLGGLVGPDGIALAPVENSGMLALMAQLRIMGCEVRAETWDAWAKFIPLISPYKDDLIEPVRDHKNILIGYSGGGWRAITLCNTHPLPHIDLLVLIDPSPKWKLVNAAVGANVESTLLIHNHTIEPLGGGEVRTEKALTRMEVAAPHLLVPELPQVQVRIMETVRNMQ